MKKSLAVAVCSSLPLLVGSTAWAQGDVPASTSQRSAVRAQEASSPDEVEAAEVDPKSDAIDAEPGSAKADVPAEPSADAEPLVPHLKESSPDPAPSEEQAAKDAPEVVPEESTAAPAVPAEDNEAVFRAFQLHSERMFRTRMAAGTGVLVAGGTMVGFGAVLWNEVPDARNLVLVGAVLAPLSIIPFALRSPAEQLARKHEVSRDTPHTAEEARKLERAWRVYAEKVRKWRRPVGWMSVGGGAVYLSLGIIEAADVDDPESPPNYVSASTQVALGAMLIIGGVSSVLLKSPAEESYDAYQAAARGTPKKSATISLTGAPAGLGLGTAISFN
jgi:hypothetical protein